MGWEFFSWFDIYLQLRLQETTGAGETELVHPNPPPALLGFDLLTQPDFMSLGSKRGNLCLL